jgi:hypothetical protein
MFIDSGSANLTAIGQTVQLRTSYLGNHEDVTSKAQYTLGEPGVVNVSSGGLITAVGRGGAVITATHDGNKTTATIRVYLIADFRGTWRFSFDNFNAANGSMTWNVSSSSASVAGTISNLVSNDVFLPNGTAGTLTGTVSGNLDNQTFTWRTTFPSSNNCPGGAQMNGSIIGLIGTQSPTQYDSGISTSSFCGISSFTGGLMRMVKQ